MREFALSFRIPMGQVACDARREQPFAAPLLVRLVEPGLAAFSAASFKVVPSVRRRQRLEIVLFLPQRFLLLVAQEALQDVPVVAMLVAAVA